MKRIWITLYCCVLTMHLMGQINLVPNGSFEDTVQCPAGSGHIEDAVGWYPAGGSADYYNTCANAAGYPNGIPDNWAGHHFAYNGNSYAGLLTYVSSFPVGIREDIGIHLTQSLIVGTKYFVSAYIIRGDSISGWDSLICASNKFGFRFSTTQYFSWPTDNFSHVHSDSIITDAVNWTRIEGSFVADSAYQYLIIGNFYDDAHTDTSQCLGGYSYYLIDQVCVSVDSLGCFANIGIFDNEKSNLNLYPNPVNGILYITGLFFDKSFSIIDLTGKIIMKGKLEKKTEQVDISRIKNGIYLFQINKLKSYKIVIIH